MKILIVDSDQKSTQKYKNALTQIGFQVSLAESAIKALKMLSADNFKLILLNIILPDMHGLNLIKTIQNNNPHFNIPIVILTDIADDNIIKEAFNLNINGYLIKSKFTPQQIAEHIKTTLYINK